MTRVIPKGHIAAALFLFCIFAVYGYQATLIDVFPGQELEPFKPNTLPIGLAGAGMVLCVLRVLQLLRAPAETPAIAFARYDWKRAGFLCLTMLAYELMLVPFGFVLATTIFLAAGFLILGERRVVLLAVFPLVFSLIFYLVMTGALGLYLSPGAWWPGGGA
jgi:putative tricarboxylic transport membrane protein